jgi:hypothetical protein
MFKMTKTLLTQLDADHGTAVDALYINHPGLDMESLFPACVGYITAPTVKLVYSRAKLHDLCTLAGYSDGMADMALNKYMLNTYFKPGPTPKAVIMEDMVKEEVAKSVQGPAKRKAEAKPEAPKPMEYTYCYQHGPRPDKLPEGCQVSNGREWKPENMEPWLWGGLKRRWPTVIAKPEAPKPMEYTYPVPPTGWELVTSGWSCGGDKFVDFGDTRWKSVNIQSCSIGWRQFGRLIRKVEQPKKVRVARRPRDTQTTVYMGNGDILKAVPIKNNGCRLSCRGCYFHLGKNGCRRTTDGIKANAFCTQPEHIRWKLTDKKWK